MASDKVALYAALDELYRRVPEVHCKRKCQEACGLILMSGLEWQRIRENGPIPRMTSMNCPLLIEGNCSVYAIRPMICRLWAAVKRMRCPWGCKPARWLSETESRNLLIECEALSGALHIGGPGMWLRRTLDAINGKGDSDGE